jgi:hypothetical protein
VISIQLSVAHGAEDRIECIPVKGERVDLLLNSLRISSILFSQIIGELLGENLLPQIEASNVICLIMDACNGASERHSMTTNAKEQQSEI